MAPASVSGSNISSSDPESRYAETGGGLSKKRRRLSATESEAAQESKRNSSPNPVAATIQTAVSASRIKPRAQQPPSGTVVALEETEVNNGKIVDSKSSFATIDVAPWLIASLAAMAIRRPTAIQKACIPDILGGRDVIGGSRTGSGKTVAFAVPILQKWAEDPTGIYAVVLTPTR